MLDNVNISIILPRIVGNPRVILIDSLFHGEKACELKPMVCNDDCHVTIYEVTLGLEGSVSCYNYCVPHFI